MSDWSWKQTAAEEILDIVNRRSTLRFHLDEVFAREAVFQNRFPRNRHVREKIRQTLQRLRDSGFLDFLGNANYQVRLAFGELAVEYASEGEMGIEVPETRAVLRRVRLRNTFLAAEMKRRYDNICQVCRETVRLSDRTYAESHHMRPLGTPHSGPDVEGNILVVCPNHHVMFDRGAIMIDPLSLVVTHIRDAIEPRRLLLRSWHALNRHYLEYHSERIFGRV